MRKFFLTALAAIALPSMAAAQEAVMYEFDGAFDDAAFGVESAIVDRGLVIDYVSHVGTMLERTREDMDSETVLFGGQANVFLFCSASLSRKVMEADPMNIAHCPYGIFVAETGEGAVQIGYRTMPEGPMQEVQALLDEIAREAAEQ